MKHLVVSVLLIFSIPLLAQKSPIGGVEFSLVIQNANFNAGSYQNFYDNFPYKNEILRPDSLKVKALGTGHSNKTLFRFSFYKDSLFIKPDSVHHRYDRLKFGIGAGRGHLSYFSLVSQGDSAEADSAYRYSVFNDLFRFSGDYQINFRSQKKLQLYTGLGLYADIKVASLLAKDGQRFDVNDTEQKVLLKRHADVGLVVPFGLKFKLARNTFFSYDVRFGVERMKDHVNKSHWLFCRSANINISVDLK